MLCCVYPGRDIYLGELNTFLNRILTQNLGRTEEYFND